MLQNLKQTFIQKVKCNSSLLLPQASKTFAAFFFRGWAPFFDRHPLSISQSSHRREWHALDPPPCCPLHTLLGHITHPRGATGLVSLHFPALCMHIAKPTVRYRKIISCSQIQDGGAKEPKPSTEQTVRKTALVSMY